MAKLFDSACGAQVIIAGNDHCPPNIHARHRAEGWMVRLSFGFLADAVDVMSIAPTERAVTKPQLKTLVDEVSEAIDMCRASWWAIQRTTCLENQQMVPGAIRDSATTITIAHYIAETRSITVTLWNGRVKYIKAGDGHGWI